MHNNDFSMIRHDVERLREEVLSRVRTIQKIKAFVASPACSACLAVIFMLCANIFVSFGDVAHNIMSQAEWGGRFSYTYSALRHTRILVQVLAFLTSISCLVLFAKILIKLRTPVSYLGNFIAEHSGLKFFRS